MIQPTKQKYRRKPRHFESVLQKACVRWFDIQYPEMSDDLFAIPNGGKRNRIEGAIMKGEGVRPGVPDLMLAIPVAPFHGLFIEMKWGDNGNSPAQTEKQKRLKSRGYAVAMCYTFDEFVYTVNKYLNI